jgi:hypothetical protein
MTTPRPKGVPDCDAEGCTEPGVCVAFPAGTFVLSERQRINAEIAALRADAERVGKLDAENRLLKQMLVNHWRQTQSTGAYLIQQGQDMERSAAAMAEHLAEIGVATDVNVFAVE